MSASTAAVALHEALTQMTPAEWAERTFGVDQERSSLRDARWPTVGEIDAHEQDALRLFDVTQKLADPHLHRSCALAHVVCIVAWTYHLSRLWFTDEHSNYSAVVDERDAGAGESDDDVDDYKDTDFVALNILTSIWLYLMRTRWNVPPPLCLPLEKPYLRSLLRDFVVGKSCPAFPMEPPPSMLDERTRDWRRVLRHERGPMWDGRAIADELFS